MFMFSLVPRAKMSVKGLQTPSTMSLRMVFWPNVTTPTQPAVAEAMVLGATGVAVPVAVAQAGMTVVPA